MAGIEEGRHAAEFVMSEAAGWRSRENGTVKSGEDLPAGQVVMWDGTDLVEYEVDTSSVVAGILLYKVDASDGAVRTAYIARDAEVNWKLLTAPAETTGGNEQATVTALLAELGIIVRDEGEDFVAP